MVAADAIPGGAAPDEQGVHCAPFVIGIAGGTASGKTTVCRRMMESLGGQRVVLLSIDEFYRGLTEEESHSDINWDVPAAFDVPEIVRCLDALIRSEDVDVPVYDFSTSTRSKTESRRVTAADVIIIEGILVLHIEEVRSRCNMKIFVDTDDDLRLARRLERDTVERGRDIQGVLAQYTNFVKPAFDKYVLPSKATADVVIPWRENRPVAVDLITQHVRLKLGQSDWGRVYPNFQLIPSTMQTRGMHTFIRDRDTSRKDFVFFVDRLCRLAIEFALAALPFEDKAVKTQTGEVYQGLKWTAKVCGVSIIRSGEAMESALRQCCTGIPIGKVLIHRDSERKEAIYQKFPHDIDLRHVLLMDPVLSSGGSAASAIESLKEAGVAEERIIMLSLVAAPAAIVRLCSQYPGVKVITSEVDRGISSANLVTPGCGDFGDRYFGTSRPSTPSSSGSNSPIHARIRPWGAATRTIATE